MSSRGVWSDFNVVAIDAVRLRTLFSNSTQSFLGFFRRKNHGYTQDINKRCCCFWKKGAVLRNGESFRGFPAVGIGSVKSMGKMYVCQKSLFGEAFPYEALC